MGNKASAEASAGNVRGPGKTQCGDEGDKVWTDAELLRLERAFADLGHGSRIEKFRGRIDPQGRLPRNFLDGLFGALLQWPTDVFPAPCPELSSDPSSDAYPNSTISSGAHPPPATARAPPGRRAVSAPGSGAGDATFRHFAAGVANLTRAPSQRVLACLWALAPRRCDWGLCHGHCHRTTDALADWHDMCRGFFLERSCWTAGAFCA